MTQKAMWDHEQQRRQFAVSRAAEVIARAELTVSDGQNVPLTELGKSVGGLVVAAAREIEKYLNETCEEGRTP